MVNYRHGVLNLPSERITYLILIIDSARYVFLSFDS